MTLFLANLRKRFGGSLPSKRIVDALNLVRLAKAKLYAD